MAYYGINFRADSAYVTDGAGETYTIGAAYPETRGGITFGYSSGAILGNSRDRDNTNDRRIAGLVYSLNSSAADVFQVDLPEGAGTYDIAIALGDAASARGNQLLLIKDGSTTLATIGPTSTSAADRFIDATGVERTDAAWPGSMALLRLTFSGSVMNLHIGNGGGGDVTGMCHVGWTKVASSSTEDHNSRRLYLSKQPRPGRGPYSTGRFFRPQRGTTRIETSDQTVALTGASATASPGSLASALSYSLSGNAATGAIGTLTSAISLALVGQGAAGSPGTIVSSITAAFTGVAGTGAAGTLSSAASYGVTGAEASVAIGSSVASVVYAITGASATGAVGTVGSGSDQSTALSGVSGTGSPGALAASVAGAMTGAAATGQAGTLTGSASYQAIGVQADAARGSLASSISYALTGTQATGAAGTVGAGADVTKALSGVVATADVGTGIGGVSFAATGAAASAAVGAMSLQIVVPLTGAHATGAPGTVSNPAADIYSADSRQRVGGATASVQTQRIGADAVGVSKQRIGRSPT